MHPARLFGALLLASGCALLALAWWLPAWLPLPRWVAIPGPALIGLGLAMLASPGPDPRPEEFDFEDWYDEATLPQKVLYSALGLGGLALGAWLYFRNSWWTELME